MKVTIGDRTGKSLSVNNSRTLFVGAVQLLISMSLLAASGCAFSSHVVLNSNESPAVIGAWDDAAETPAAEVHAPTPATSVDETNQNDTASLASDGQDDAPGFEDDATTEDEPPDEEIDGPVSGVAIRYTTDLSDDELAWRWKSAPDSLGSVSFGLVERGRLFNALSFPDGDGWKVVDPSNSYATQETIDYLTTAIGQVKAWHPDAALLRVGSISKKNGGHFRPHRSHQNGRDVDLSFYYPAEKGTIRVVQRERVIDVEKNWALVKALVMYTDVQYILVDKRIQKVLYNFALKKGEDKVWLESIFAGLLGRKKGIVQHAKRHRDHFHVRFFNPRAQELARRLVPLLPATKELSMASHRVKAGETLAGIAGKYGVSVQTLRSKNRLKGNSIRLAQTLKIPMQSLSGRFAAVPAITVPARKLPPVEIIPTASATAAASP